MNREIDRKNDKLNFESDGVIELSDGIDIAQFETVLFIVESM